jgi:hypothetical protein
MKKGCFITAITLFTIIIAVGLFLYRKYWPEIEKVGKEKIIEFAIKDLDKKLNELDRSRYNDSLKLFLVKSVNYFKSISFEEGINQFSEIIDQTNFFINDGKIDSIEFKALKNMARKYERSTQN